MTLGYQLALERVAAAARHLRSLVPCENDAEFAVFLCAFAEANHRLDEALAALDAAAARNRAK